MTEFRRALDRSSFGTEGSRKARRTVTQEQRSRVLDKIATKRSSTSKKRGSMAADSHAPKCR